MARYASQPASVEVGATPVQLLAENRNRNALLIQNAHEDQDLYLGFGYNPGTDSGIKVAAGQAFTYEGFEGPVYGVASGEATDVRVVEFY